MSLTPLLPWSWKMRMLRAWLARSYYRPCGLSHLIPTCDPHRMLFTGHLSLLAVPVNILIRPAQCGAAQCNWDLQRMLTRCVHVPCFSGHIYASAVFCAKASGCDSCCSSAPAALSTLILKCILKCMLLARDCMTPPRTTRQTTVQIASWSDTTSQTVKQANAFYS